MQSSPIISWSLISKLSSSSLPVSTFPAALCFERHNNALLLPHPQRELLWCHGEAILTDLLQRNTGGKRSQNMTGVREDAAAAERPQKTRHTFSFSCTSMFPAFFKGSVCWLQSPTGAHSRTVWQRCRDKHRTQTINKSRGRVPVLLWSLHSFTPFKHLMLSG